MFVEFYQLYAKFEQTSNISSSQDLSINNCLQYAIFRKNTTNIQKQYTKIPNFKQKLNNLNESENCV